MSANALFKNLFIFIVLFLVAFSGQKVLAQTQAPTILDTSIIEKDGVWQISVNGLTTPGNAVLIYLNGSYNGMANISKNDNDFYNFSYLSPSIPRITPFHVFAINKDLNSQELSSMAESDVNTIIKKSQDSLKAPDVKKIETTKEEPVFLIAKRTESPILISPSGETDNQKPMVSGFSKNDTYIKIFIDTSLVSEIHAKNNISETASFEFYPKTALATGTHTAYTVARKDGEKESEKSNVLTFTIKEKKSPSGIVLGEKASSTEDVLSSSTKIQENNQDKINKASGNKKWSAFNFILFGAFAISIIVWIVAISRELKKEGKESKKD